MSTDGTKTCTRCGEVLPLTMFHRRTAAPDGYNSWCKRCRAEYARDSRPRARSEPSLEQRRELAMEAVLDHLLSHPCVDCGEDDPVVLEFDHVGPKTASVSQLVAIGMPVDTIMNEIALCHVRCANCHRRKTLRDFGSYRVERTQ